VQIGVCGESCQGLLPDTCTGAEERCFQIRTDGAGVCWEHGGGGLGDTCAEFTDCGAELYCDFQGQCATLCDPFGGGADNCAVNEACAPFDAEIGGCFPLTSSGSAEGDMCLPANGMCDDAMICTSLTGAPPTRCIEFCRVSMNGPDGSNPDCTAMGAQCQSEGGGAEVGLCMLP